MKRSSSVFSLGLAIAACWPANISAAQDTTVVHRTHNLTTPQSVCAAIQTYFKKAEDPGASHAERAASISVLIPGWPFMEGAGSAWDQYQGLQKGLTLSLQWTMVLAANLSIRLGTLPLIDCRATADPNLLLMVLRFDGRDLAFGIHVEWIWTGYLVRRLSVDGLSERLKEAYRKKL